jgi:hypothetical protein
MAAVAVAAAVLSFSALAGLAQLAGVEGEVSLGLFDFRLRWLLPIAVDAYAVTSTRIWLTAAGDVREYAKKNAVGAIGLSVLGNAVYHVLDAADVESLTDEPYGWLVVVAVSAVAPLMLGLVVHLRVLLQGQPSPAEVVVPDVAAMVRVVVTQALERVGADVGRLRAEVADLREQLDRRPVEQPRLKAVPPQLPAGASLKDKAKAAAQTYRREHGDLPGRKRLAEVSGLSEGTCRDALRELTESTSEERTA